MKSLLGALLLAFVSGGVGAGLVILLNDGTKLETGGDRFDVLTALLPIMLGIFGVGGFFTFQIIRDRLESDLEKRVKDGTEELRTGLRGAFAQLHHEIGNACWQEYEELWRLSSFKDLNDDSA